MNKQEILHELRQVREGQQAIVNALRGTTHPQSRDVLIKSESIARFCDALESAVRGGGAALLSTYK